MSRVDGVGLRRTVAMPRPDEILRLTRPPSGKPERAPFGYVSPFILSPLHTFLSFFVSVPFCLHVPPSHSVLSARNGPALSMYERADLQPRFQVAQVLTMSGSLVVPVHLVSLHRNHIHWSCLVSFSCLHLFLLCALTFARPFCMHARMHACMYVCMYVCMYTYIYVCVYVFMYVCMYVSSFCMYVCMRACVHACTHVHMYVLCRWVGRYVYIYVYVRMFFCLYVVYCMLRVCTFVFCVFVCLYVCCLFAHLR